MREYGATHVCFDGIDVTFAPRTEESESFEVHDTEDAPGIVEVAGQRAHDLVKRDSKPADPTLNDWFRKERPFQPVGVPE